MSQNSVRATAARARNRNKSQISTQELDDDYIDAFLAGTRLDVDEDFGYNKYKVVDRFYLRIPLLTLDHPCWRAQGGDARPLDQDRRSSMCAKFYPSYFFLSFAALHSVLAGPEPKKIFLKRKCVTILLPGMYVT